MGLQEGELDTEIAKWKVLRSIEIQVEKDDK
jgi:hypothetical protein